MLIVCKKLKKNKWRPQGISSNTFLAAGVAVALGMKIYIIGGHLSESDDDFTTNSELIAFDTQTEKFSIIDCSGTPPSCVNHSAVLIGSSVYVYGGREEKTTIDGVTCLELETLHWRECANNGQVPPARLYHAAAAHRESFYVFGGAPDPKTTGPDDVKFNDLYKYDTASETWSKIETNGTPPSPRGSCGLSVFEDRYLVLWGGYDGCNALNDLHLLDLSNNAWLDQLSVSGTAPSPRAGHVSVLWKDKLVVWGGFSTQDGDVDDLHVLDLSALPFVNPIPASQTTQTSQVPASQLPASQVMQN